MPRTEEAHARLDVERPATRVHETRLPAWVDHDAPLPHRVPDVLVHLVEARVLAVPVHHDRQRHSGWSGSRRLEHVPGVIAAATGAGPPITVGVVAAPGTRRGLTRLGDRGGGLAGPGHGRQQRRGRRAARACPHHVAYPVDSTIPDRRVQDASLPRGGRGRRPRGDSGAAGRRRDVPQPGGVRALRGPRPRRGDPARRGPCVRGLPVRPRHRERGRPRSRADLQGPGRRPRDPRVRLPPPRRRRPHQRVLRHGPAALAPTRSPMRWRRSSRSCGARSGCADRWSRRGVEPPVLGVRRLIASDVPCHMALRRAAGDRRELGTQSRACREHPVGDRIDGTDQGTECRPPVAREVERQRERQLNGRHHSDRDAPREDQGALVDIRDVAAGEQDGQCRERPDRGQQDHPHKRGDPLAGEGPQTAVTPPSQFAQVDAQHLALAARPAATLGPEGNARRTAPPFRRALAARTRFAIPRSAGAMRGRCPPSPSVPGTRRRRARRRGETARALRPRRRPCPSAPACGGSGR